MKYQPNGFTLVEALVAITILIVGVLGPLNIAARGIADGLYARNQIAANYLAQEAIETVIWKRNHNFFIDTGIDYNAWLIGLDSASCGDLAAPNSCVINVDTGNVSLVSCSSSAELGTTDCDLAFESSVGGDGKFKKYSEIGDKTKVVGTIFRREIYLIPNTEIGETDEIKVVVRMSWSNRGTPKSMFLIERLYPRIR